MDGKGAEIKINGQKYFFVHVGKSYKNRQLLVMG